MNEYMKNNCAYYCETYWETRLNYSKPVKRNVYMDIYCQDNNIFSIKLTFLSVLYTLIVIWINYAFFHSASLSKEFPEGGHKGAHT